MFNRKLNNEDIQYMVKMAQDRFDNIIKALRNMPRSMLLVIRYVSDAYHYIYKIYNTWTTVTHHNGPKAPPVFD